MFCGRFLFFFSFFNRYTVQNKKPIHVVSARWHPKPLYLPESFSVEACKLEAGMRLKVKAFQFYLTPSLWFNMKPACVQMITESKRLTSIGLTDCLCVRACVCERWSVCMHTCMFRGGVWLWLHMSVRVCNCVCVWRTDRQTAVLAHSRPVSEWLVKPATLIIPL